MLEKNKIYLMDCFEFLNEINNETIDLAVIDPPYNLNKGKWDNFKSQNEFMNFTFKWIDRLIPKLKKTGSIYIFNTPFNSTYILQYLINKGLIFQNWITWDKRDGMSATKRRYNNSQETILFFTKTKEYVFNYNDIRLPYDSKERIRHAQKKGIIKNGKRWFPNPSGKLCTDIWHITSERHKNKINGRTPKMPHATPKPLEMIERIIKASSNKGDLVLDCFIGTGTTAFAAKKLERHYIGCDNNKKYVQIAENRLKNGKF
ncbi:MAG: Modification methylase MboII [Syntrophomonadaceae bacterium]|nr:Modification methylase MboII [Bacillota bacterium]